MTWAAPRTWARLTTGALVGVALMYLLSTVTVRELNAASVVVLMVLLGLAGLAATGRWWALAMVALFSAMLTVVAIGQVTRLVDEGDTGELLGVLAFQFLLAIAAITGLFASVRSYRDRQAGP